MLNSTRQEFDHEETLDIRAMLSQLLRAKWWILGGTVVCALAFAAAAFLMTPIYRASAVLIPVSAERNSLAGTSNSALGSIGGGLASLAGLNISTNDPATEEALGVLRSKEFVQSFIVDNNLMPQLFRPGRHGLLDAILRRKSPPTLNRGIKYFIKNIRSVLQDTKTGLVTVQVDWKDRNAAAAWANEMVKRVNSEMRTRAVSNAEASIAFLERELSRTSLMETRDAINRLIETQEKQKMLANVTEEYAFRVVDPAIAPDADDLYKPPKWLLVTGGPIVGFVLSSALVLMFGIGGSAAAARRRSSI
jgi:uncharacterized protein involved in exopolysaccharide biosynthesis